MEGNANNLHTLKEAATLMHVSLSMARRLLRDEPGLVFFGQGPKKLVRIPLFVIQRVIRRSSGPAGVKHATFDHSQAARQ